MVLIYIYILNLLQLRFQNTLVRDLIGWRGCFFFFFFFFGGMRTTILQNDDPLFLSELKVTIFPFSKKQKKRLLF